MNGELISRWQISKWTNILLIPVELDSNILNKFFHLKIADGKFMVDREEIVYESVSHVFKERLIIGIFFFEGSH